MRSGSESVESGNRFSVANRSSFAAGPPTLASASSRDECGRRVLLGQRLRLPRVGRNGLERHSRGEAQESILAAEMRPCGSDGLRIVAGPMELLERAARRAILAAVGVAVLDARSRLRADVRGLHQVGLRAAVADEVIERAVPRHDHVGHVV